MTTRFDEEHDETMAAMLRALETAPDIVAPADFAARVMARVPETSRMLDLRRARALSPRYGRIAVFASLGIVLVGMLLVARMHGVTTLGSGLQLLLLVQLAAYVLWIGFASWRSQ